MLSGRRPSPSHLGVFVEVHAGFRGDVLGADDLTVSLKALQLEELGCRKELRRRQGQNRGSVMPEARHRAGFRVSRLVHSYLHDFSVAYVQGLGAAAVQILHDQLQNKSLVLRIGWIAV